ncbi:unnamed protein product [Adineta steineri]|uniref:Uncharacterized protein n=4 Tax=Adineta steineri TaxID=433720 RepID=A0A819K789_9BILA|nr:unnamed protein product [Adineta steineri]
MFSIKSLKQFLNLKSKKYPLTESNTKLSSTSLDKAVLNKNHVTYLKQWLDQLNADQLITMTDQNDIIIMPEGINNEAQQFFINQKDIDVYMKTKANGMTEENEEEVISMTDIAQILLQLGYVKEINGELSFIPQNMIPDSSELTWLISIVHDVQPYPQNYETDVKLFDGENTQTLHIPYEHMTPTSDIRTVATYLYRNGRVRYDVETGLYAYRYIEPNIPLDQKTEPPKRNSQHQLLSRHIRQIYADERKKRVEVEFMRDPNHRLILPANWYDSIRTHNFDRNYIIDTLLTNGGIIDDDSFTFKNYVYSLHDTRKARTVSASTPSTVLRTVNLPNRQKHDLIRRYVDLVIRNDGVSQHKINRLIQLENPTDGRQLYFTPQDSQFIRQKQFQREDVINLLVNNAQIKRDESAHWLYYNNQYIQLPSSLISLSTTSSQNVNNLVYPSYEQRSHSMQEISRPMTTNNYAQRELPDQFHRSVDHMCRNGLVTWDKPAKLILIQFANNQILRIPIDRLRSIIDPHIVSSSSGADGVLPFDSHQLAQWLLKNSEIQ